MNWNAKFFSFMFVSWFQLSRRPMQRIRILEFEENLLVESGINPGLWDPQCSSRDRNPTKDWNPESKFRSHKLESSTWNQESSAWNPEFKTVLDFLTWSDSRLIWPSLTISGMHKKVTVPHLSRTVPIFQWIHSKMNVVIVPWKLSYWPTYELTEEE